MLGADGLLDLQVLVRWFSTVFAYLSDKDFEAGMRDLLKTKSVPIIQLPHTRHAIATVCFLDCLFQAGSG